MTRLSEISAHMASMDELLDVVGAMRSLAGMRVQEAQRALPGIRSYADSMAAAVGSALLFMPRQPADSRQDHGRRGIVLCTAEHGFVGGYNEKLIGAAESALKPSDLLFVLGSRGAALASEHEHPLAWAKPMATRVAAAPDTINDLTIELYGRIARGELTRVEVMFGRYRQGAAATIEARLLLPLDMASLSVRPLRQPPLHNLAPRLLLEKLIAEYVFALLTEAAVESIASENAARFAAMESAHDNVSKKLNDLTAEARSARQSEITSELLDLITGAEAAAHPYG